MLNKHFFYCHLSFLTAAKAAMNAARVALRAQLSLDMVQRCSEGCNVAQKDAA